MRIFWQKNRLKEKAISGRAQNTGWAEWSIPEMSEPTDRELWYETNPSLGTVFTERSVANCEHWAVGSSEGFDYRFLSFHLRMKERQPPRQGTSGNWSFADDDNLICLEFRIEFTLILKLGPISVNDFPATSNFVRGCRGSKPYSGEQFTLLWVELPIQRERKVVIRYFKIRILQNR